MGKQSGKRLGRLPGLRSTIYPKFGFRLPSVLLPDKHGPFLEADWGEGAQKERLVGQKADRKRGEREDLPGCLPEPPWFASAYLPGCGVCDTLQKLNFQIIK